MTTKKDLINLGYNTKTILENNSGKLISTDFRYGKVGERPYLVNLSLTGEVDIIFPNNAKNTGVLTTSDLSKFIDWHNSQ
ncbi:hypothetical protein [Algoriphagus sp. Y33]|uniref:hypothetical protein n=1 Tax=Algoriphagus sp. Y33 TaxID=2772483 RepID=UPI00178110AC|nr:hypothetical protein [Algoriphagus sp. Y33]